MASIDDRLNSLTETVICIPYKGLDQGNSVSPLQELKINDKRTLYGLDVESDIRGDRPPPSSTTTVEDEIFTMPSFKERDLPDGARLRMRLYNESWGRCKKRVQDSIRELHAPIVQRVLGVVHASYTSEEPLMAYTEMPTIIISGSDRSETASVVSEVSQKLRRSLTREEDLMSDDGTTNTDACEDTFVSSFSSSDCPNLPSAMKSLIGGFVKYDPEDIYREGQSTKAAQKHPSSSTLAPFDMNVLEAWYRAVTHSKGKDRKPKLIVLVHDFETIDPSLMQDVFYISSLYVPRLPIVFILSCSSPPQTSFIHTVYPRTTLTLLELTRIAVPNGPEALEHVLLKTFFDVDFHPTILPSPATLDFVVEQFSLTAMSLDMIVMVLQLVYLRHFMDPLSALAVDELLGESALEEAVRKLERPGSRSFLDSLLARLHHPEKSGASEPPVNGTLMEVDEDLPNGNSTEKHHSPSRSSIKGKARADAAFPTSQAKWKPGSETALGILELVRGSREHHWKQAVNARVAFRVFLLARESIVQSGFKGLLDAGYRGTDGARKAGRTLSQMMVACLRGTLAARDGRAVASAVRKLPSERLSSLISRLYTFVRSLPSDIRNEESETMVKFVEWNARLGTSPDEARSVAKEVEEWLLDYLSDRIKDHTETNMWDIWFTRGPQGICELFNPSPRSSVTAALVHPDQYLDIGEAKANLESPDTCILFQRYLESGRMINVYDWFEAFSSALDSQRRRRRKHDGADGKRRSGKKQKGTTGDAKARSARRAQNGRVRRASFSPTKRRLGGKSDNGKAITAVGGKGKSKMGVGAYSSGPDSSSDGDGDKDEKDADGGESEFEDEEAKELRRMEAHARFVRAAQELDYMGFVRHTGRKADHVHKTVYDVAEYVE